MLARKVRLPGIHGWQCKTEFWITVKPDGCSIFRHERLESASVRRESKIIRIPCTRVLASANLYRHRTFSPLTPVSPHPQQGHVRLCKVRFSKNVFGVLVVALHASSLGSLPVVAVGFLFSLECCQILFYWNSYTFLSHRCRTHAVHWAKWIFLWTFPVLLPTSFQWAVRGFTFCIYS